MLPSLSCHLSATINLVSHFSINRAVCICLPVILSSIKGQAGTCVSAQRQDIVYPTHTTKLQQFSCNCGSSTFFKSHEQWFSEVARIRYSKLKICIDTFRKGHSCSIWWNGKSCFGNRKKHIGQECCVSVLPPFKACLLTWRVGQTVSEVLVRQWAGDIFCPYVAPSVTHNLWSCGWFLWFPCHAVVN